MADVEEEGHGVPEWVVTYGDMMSLLLTFFIMLVSMSELKEDGRNRAMMDAIRQRFGPGAGITGIFGRSLQTSSAYRFLRSEGQRMEGGTKRRSRQAKGPGGAFTAVRRINHGTIITLGGPAIFPRFGAELSDDLKARLDVITRVIKHKPNKIVVRGHATPEPLPPGSPYRDPTDLSYARARNVAEYLMKKGIAPERLYVSAVGASEPWRITKRPDVFSQNHRVDVFVIDSYISPSQLKTKSSPTRKSTDLQAVP